MIGAVADQIGLPQTLAVLVLAPTAVAVLGGRAIGGIERGVDATAGPSSRRDRVLT